MPPASSGQSHKSTSSIARSEPIAPRSPGTTKANAGFGDALHSRVRSARKRLMRRSKRIVCSPKVRLAVLALFAQVLRLRSALKTVAAAIAPIDDRLAVRPQPNRLRAAFLIGRAK
jgi:hypothetical protein